VRAVAPCGTIDAVLPRRTAFSRKRAAQEAVAQTLAANIDAAFVLVGLDADFSLRRLERYLTAAWESGAQPVVVLTKADLCADVAETSLAAERVAVGAPVHPLSNLTGEGLDCWRGTSAPAAPPSSSAPRAWASRACSTGSLDIDSAFDDIEALGAECRFSDCAHTHEPGCAGLAAVDEGTLPLDRLRSWRKPQRELASIAARRDRRLRAERKRRWKQHARSTRRGSW
jgi:ribosome biogenesis GTPase / thiamine phosphate phosphatase